MPSNAASGCSCFINLLQAGEDHFTPATRLPCTEYLTETIRNPKTGATQEVATIESQGACRFEITLTVTPDAYSSLSASSSTLQNAPDAHVQSPVVVSHPNSAMTPYQPMIPQPAQLVHRPDYIYKIILDGLNVGQGPLNRGILPCTTHASEIFSLDSSTLRRLQFAPVHLVDPDEHMDAADPADRMCEDEKVIKSLGIIRIDIYRCFLGSRPRPLRDLSAPVQTSNQMKFNERSKKAALSNTAGLAPPVPSPRPPTPTTWVVEHIDTHPFLEFVFKYKPKAVLEHDGTIPQTVQPAETLLQPNTDIIEIKSESESEEEDADRQGKRKAKRIKIEAKKAKRTDKKPVPPPKDRKPSQKPNFLDLAGSDDD